MLTRIRKWLAPPTFEDEDKTRIANLLNIILSAVFVITLLLTLATGLLPGSEPTVLGRMTVGVMTATLVLAIWFSMRRGYVQLASVLLSSMLLVNATIVVYLVGTIRAPITAVYIVCIVIASLLIGSRAAVVFSSLSLLALLGLWQAEMAGLLPPAQASSGINNWITHTAILSMTAVLLSLATRGINEALERARRNERALAESNRELQAEIAERVRAEQALRESEERFRSIVEQSSDGIILTDEQGSIIEWNRGQEQITGVEQVDALGRLLWDVQFQVSPEERNTPATYEQARASMLKFLETGQAPWLGQPQEMAIMRPDGTRRIIQAMIFPINTGKGFMAGSISRDITERRRTEEQLGRYRDHLEELVEERTRELKEAQAELIRKERLSALGQLTTTVAHEIRNPLGTVRTAVFAVGDAIQRDEMYRLERALQLAERNIIRCDRIITELLDYTRERALNLEPTSVDEWLDALLGEQAIPGDIVCEKELSAGAEVPIDREHLRRAVINVVENAVDALQEEGRIGKKLTVSSHVVGGRLEIRVSDTGPGIPADVMEKIFEPLFSTKSFGVGLGLPIVKNILQQHDGDIEIKSRVGEPGPEPVEGGTTVTLWLPVPNLKIS